MERRRGPPTVDDGWLQVGPVAPLEVALPGGLVTFPLLIAHLVTEEIRYDMKKGSLVGD